MLFKVSLSSGQPFRILSRPQFDPGCLLQLFDIADEFFGMVSHLSQRGREVSAFVILGNAVAADIGSDELRSVEGNVPAGPVTVGNARIVE